MKKLIFFSFLLISIFGYSQVNRYSTVTPSRYEPRSYDELSVVAMTLQKRYEANQKYLYDLKKWILELKPQISEQQFLNRLDKEYKDLTDIEDGDLARASKYLQQTENAVREIISDYNVWVNQQNTQKQSSTNSNQNNTSSQSYSQKGYELQQNGEYADAVFNYTKHLENDKNNTDILFLRAMCKSELNDKYGAISDLDKIIEFEGKVTPKVYKMSTVYNNKAYCLVGLKQYEEALPLVEKALKLDKSEWYIWDTRGEIYLNLGQLDKSISDLTKAIGIEEHDNSYYLRGLAYLKQGNKTKGCKDLSKAGELGNAKAYEEISKKCN